MLSLSYYFTFCTLYKYQSVLPMKKVFSMLDWNEKYATLRLQVKTINMLFFFQSLFKFDSINDGMGFSMNFGEKNFAKSCQIQKLVI